MPCREVACNFPFLVTAATRATCPFGPLTERSQAGTALGRLDGLAEVLPDTDLFVAMYVRQQALLSSRIEGTECTMDEVLAFELLKDAEASLDMAKSSTTSPPARTPATNERC